MRGNGGEEEVVNLIGILLQIIKYRSTKKNISSQEKTCNRSDK